MGTVIGVILILGIVFGVAFIRSYITKRGNEARAERERIAAANYLQATPAPPHVVPATHALPMAPAINPRYAVDDPPPPPPPGW